MKETRYIYWRKDTRLTYCPKGKVGYRSIEKVPFSKMYKTLTGCVKAMDKDCASTKKWSKVPVTYGVDVVIMQVVSRETMPT